VELEPVRVKQYQTAKPDSGAHFLDWARVCPQVETPTYIYCLCPMFGKGRFIACADNFLQVFEYDGERQPHYKHLLEVRSHEKVVNMCQMLQQGGTADGREMAFACSRDPLIKLFDLTIDED